MKQATVQCRRCKRRSTLPELFRRKVCPRCVERRSLLTAKLFYLGIILWVLFDWLLRGFTLDVMSRASLIYLTVIGISTLLLIGHEVSHALMARLLGGQLFGITLGIGSTLHERWFGRFRLQINLFPLSGLCYAGFPPQQASRTRYALYVSAGLLFHLVAALITFALRDSATSWLQYVLGLTFFALNVTYFVNNLLPRTVITAEGPTDSDGLNLWKLLRGQLTTPIIEQKYFRIQAWFAYIQDEIELAMTACEAGLQHDPDDPVLANLRSVLLLNQTDLAEAYTTWKHLVETEPEENPILRALLFNNYAWILLLHRPAEIELATFYSEKAFAMTPWLSSVCGTYAAVQIARGNHEASISIVERNIEEIREDKKERWREQLAINLVFLAVAKAGIGQEAEAEKLMIEARQQSAENDKLYETLGAFAKARTVKPLT